MLNLVNIALGAVWPTLSNNLPLALSSPTDRAQFELVKVNEDSVDIRTNTTILKMSRGAFLRGLEYLVQNGHIDKNNKCEIRSDQNNPGPLSAAMSDSTLRTSTYVLPILQHMGLVEIDPGRPPSVSSSVWLASK